MLYKKLFILQKYQKTINVLTKDNIVVSLFSVNDPPCRSFFINLLFLIHSVIYIDGKNGCYKYKVSPLNRFTRISCKPMILKRIFYTKPIPKNTSFDRIVLFK